MPSQDQERLSEVYATIQELKSRRKQLSDAFKDALVQHVRFQEVSEELQTLRAEKKSIEEEVRAQAPSEQQQMEELALEIQANEELLSDLALNLLLSNQTVELTDQADNKYIPQIRVKFKKS